MKIIRCICGVLILAFLLAGGCTSPPAPSPSTPVPTTATTVPEGPPVPARFLLTDTVWDLAWFDDTTGVWSKVADGSTVSATFFPDGIVNGTGGCNRYSTRYELGEAHHIYIVRPVVPDHLCQSPVGVMTQESEFFTDLARADSYVFNETGFQIFDNTGRKILEFITL